MALSKALLQQYYKDAQVALRQAEKIQHPGLIAARKNSLGLLKKALDRAK